MLEVTIHIPGLMELTEAINNLAGSEAAERNADVPVSSVAPSQAVMPAPAVQEPVPAPAPPVQQAVPVTPRTYTPDDLSRAAMSLMDSGRQAELVALLHQFGVVSIPALSPERYGDFATALRGMGAQI